MPLIADAIHVWREPEGDYHVEWAASHPATRVTVEPLTPAGQVSAHYEETATRARIRGLPLNCRHFFRLRDQHGNETIVTERKLGMQGTPNFRDFGGYPGADGRRVRWGYLYRSGHLSRLTNRDLDLLQSLELDLVCDFRRDDERLASPNRLPPSRPPRVVSLPITPGSNAAVFAHGELDLGGRQPMFDFMVDINRDFVEAQAATYARMFREILAQPDSRFLIHCAAGKDRTGFAAALILLVLGVPVERVMHDYMLTRRYYDPALEIERLRRKYGFEDVPAEAVLPMLEVHEAYLARAFDAIAEYGEVTAWLEDVLGVGPAEREELRRRYLEPDPGSAPQVSGTG
ncbi:tyrosine-protein phosphatase [Kineobactrum salinum]|uniref:Tyrosine-protein phosphatase n=1 Tax=Kineobactrum salinum TaxID=2708301 RepID=A0A6C0U6Z1_9GAMM|nr:tyrosine-protein phosphatase [Kineobactrum salinum]QIB65224.1 tyrosine-protein phosphatase [Kineobactrum salinum]